MLLTVIEAQPINSAAVAPVALAALVELVVPEDQVVLVVLEALVVPADQAELVVSVVPADQVALAELVVSVVPADQVAPAELVALVVPENQAELVEPENQAELVEPVVPAVPAVLVVPVAERAPGRLLARRVAETMSGIAACRIQITAPVVAVLEVAVAETTPEPVAVEAVTAWAAADIVAVVVVVDLVVAAAAAAEVVVVVVAAVVEEDVGGKKTLDEEKPNEIKINYHEFVENFPDRSRDRYLRDSRSRRPGSEGVEKRCERAGAVAAKAIQHSKRSGRRSCAGGGVIRCECAQGNSRAR